MTSIRRQLIMGGYLYVMTKMPSRSRIMVYLPEEPLNKLKEWAKQENRPASNLAATVLLKAIEEWEKQKQNGHTD
ncbi:MAG TPA: hypothetical protein V6D11_07710 [Waterburya sp.]